MKHMTTDYEEFEASSWNNSRMLREEEFILAVTELLCQMLRNEGISKVELARRLGKTKGFVTQILSGGRNLTLRTVSDVADALGYKIEIGSNRSPRLHTAEASIANSNAKVCDINNWKKQSQHQWTRPSFNSPKPDHGNAEIPDESMVAM
jgi:transcriptional regulator with XRE-family HTH domain